MFRDIPRDSRQVAVLIEFRKHPYIEYVMRNVMYFLGPEWGLQVFVWRKNREFMENILRDWSHVDIVELPEQSPGYIPQDAVMRSEEFWQGVKGETQLFFDLDSLLCRHGIEDFADYDFVAAPWLPGYAVSPACRFGSGGLSLRKKSAMLDVIRTVNTRDVIVGREDLMFSVHLHLNRGRYRLPSVETAQSFAVECVYHPRPLGLHRSWVCLPDKQLQELLERIEYRHGVTEPTAAG